MGLKALDLCAGIGGFSLGFERAGIETVAFCEIDKFCQKVLRKHWSEVPIYEDIRTLKGADVGPVDIISAGYPCQPFSLAGKRHGEKDDRHLWPEVLRLLHEIRPTWFIGENVAGHISMGLDQVLSDLESEDYACQTFVIPACAVDAPHRRDRVWIVAHSKQSGPQRRAWERMPRTRWTSIKPAGRGEALANTESERCGETGQLRHNEPKKRIASGGEDVADPESIRGDVIREAQETGQRCEAGRCSGKLIAWPTEPDVGRVAHGIPRRVDRLRSLGNAVVPQIPELIGRAIMETEV